MELSLEEKKKFSVEILFNIFQYDFKNEEINTKINQQLNVYDYCYSMNILYANIIIISIINYQDLTSLFTNIL